MQSIVQFGSLKVNLLLFGLNFHHQHNILKLFWLNMQGVYSVYYIDSFPQEVIWTFYHHLLLVLATTVVKISPLFLRTKPALATVA